MCTGASFALYAALAATAVSTAVTMYSTDTQAKQHESDLKFQADQAAADARTAQGEAEVEAMRIRKAAKSQRAQATAAAAASGVDVNSPTAVRLDQEIVKNSEEDARLTILNGVDRSSRLNQQGYLDSQGASIARQNGQMQNAGTLLSGVASGINTYSGWKRAGGAA